MATKWTVCFAVLCRGEEATTDVCEGFGQSELECIEGFGAGRGAGGGHGADEWGWGRGRTGALR